MLRSQFWKPERIRSYQSERLNQVFKKALKIPFYRTHINKEFKAKDFDQIPVLKREDIPQLKASIESLYPSGYQFIRGASGGSTGMPREFYFSEAHQISRNAARMRFLRINGWSPRISNAWIIHLPKEGPDNRLLKDPLLWRTRFMSTAHNLDQQWKWLIETDPAFLYTLPSTLNGLLDRIAEAGKSLPNLKKLFCGGEVVDDSLREKALQLTGLPIVDNYGSTEAFLAWQCPEHSYHINSEQIIFEIVDKHDRPVQPGEMGRVLITTLWNDVMPLIRYEIGDYAISSDSTCPCGRTLPLIQRIIGRQVNLFRLKNNQLLSPIEVLVKLASCHQLKQYQVIQETIDQFVIRFVSDNGLSVEYRQRLLMDIQSILDYPVEIQFEQVDSISRTPRGKYMTTISRVK